MYLAVNDLWFFHNHDFLFRLIDSHIDSLRVIKSPSEIDLMRKCGDITAEMFMESMRFSVENVCHGRRLLC